MVDDRALYVEQEFSNPYTICDNMWHRIQAIYNDKELSLKVDELDQKYGLPTNNEGHFMGSAITNSLYIGGIPGNKAKHWYFSTITIIIIDLKLNKHLFYILFQHLHPRVL